MSRMPRDAISVKQIEYKNAELVLSEFMALQDYDIDSLEMNTPRYKDFNLQELHDFIADKIEALDDIINNKWTRWPYQKKGM